tara:strand:+ start:210 stop:485 length:276 start_codon:yes stop_codon:yes gene_type:complete
MTSQEHYAEVIEEFCKKYGVTNKTIAFFLPMVFARAAKVTNKEKVPFVQGAKQELAEYIIGVCTKLAKTKEGKEIVQGFKKKKEAEKNAAK